MGVGGWGATEAEAWKRSAEARNRMLAAATERMLAEAGLAPGQRVLEVGTGTGDAAILAAALVSPGGSVLATDVSPAMVEATTEAVRTLGLANVEVRRMDAGAIDLPAGSFDAVIARKSLMFIPDRAQALAGLRRVLKPGGRLSAVVWAPLDRNPFHRILIDAVKKHGCLPEPTPEVVIAFSSCDPEGWRRAVVEAGFREVEVQPVPSVRRAASAVEMVATSKDSPIYQEALSALSPSERDRAWSDIEAGYRAFEGPGGCELPMESLLLVGEKSRN